MTAKKNTITEIVSFDIEYSISEEVFTDIVKAPEVEFHMIQSGYIDSELV